MSTTPLAVFGPGRPRSQIDGTKREEYAKRLFNLLRLDVIVRNSQGALTGTEPHASSLEVKGLCHNLLRSA